MRKTLIKMEIMNERRDTIQAELDELINGIYQLKDDLEYAEAQYEIYGVYYRRMDMLETPEALQQFDTINDKINTLKEEIKEKEQKYEIKEKELNQHLEVIDSILRDLQKFCY